VKIARRRATAGWVYLAAAGLLGRGAGAWLAAGIAAAAAGEALRTWAAGTIRKNEKLAQGGPYALCRHPLYLGSLLIAAGAAVAARHPLVWAFFAVCFPLFYAAAVAGEERFLARKFGADYEAYRKRTPLLVPLGRSAVSAPFSWRQAARNGEFVNWAAVAAVFLLIRFWGVR